MLMEFKLIKTEVYGQLQPMLYLAWPDRQVCPHFFPDRRSRAPNDPIQESDEGIWFKNRSDFSTLTALASFPFEAG
jgi:hypothetical protein